MLRRPPYPSSLESRKEIEKNINELVDMYVIRKIGDNEIVEITTPVLITWHDGNSRLCGDFRALNNYTKAERYPILKINHPLDKLAKAKYITKMDCMKGFCQNHGNSPPWISVWHIKTQSFYGQLAISITSGQYGHIIILWTIYGHLFFGAFMALHLNPEAIAAIYSQSGISGHFPQNQGKWPKWMFWQYRLISGVCAFLPILCIFVHLRTLTQSVQKTLSSPLGHFFGSKPKSGQKAQRTQKHLSKL
ncbi:hypothetical protein O181_106335 [Austropuccinia psidii MF-1]|uniref:Uncharacterized protein n=1 Tax=Austropuccinia psidii MF-1 TaxID=1389203 RepID=A0A9Q3JSB1_9BASI|nr:hypothetical protein [Austropuccinia psidii MF-1]